MTERFGRVGVFCGGSSGERDISLQTGKAVHEALIEEGVDALLVDVGNDPMNFDAYNVAFIALHGRDGEDGKFQSILEYYDIPYTGSGVQASSISMNKWHTKAVWQSVGISTPDYWILHNDINPVCGDIDYPVFVKPVNEGSSIGISHVQDDTGLEDAVKLALQYDQFVLVEKAVSGKEYTFSYLHGRNDLPLIMLDPKNDFYDYEAKYLSNDTSYIVDPDLSDEVKQYCKSQATKAFKLLGMSGWGRVDFIIDKDNVAWFIEANSVPGMTSHSLVPMAAKSAGISFGELCVKILDTAFHEK